MDKENKNDQLVELDLNDSHDVFMSIMNDKINELSAKMDELIVEGLARKGYEFNNRLDLEQFIKSHCNIIGCGFHQYRIFYVKNIPFLFHDYGNDLMFPKLFKDSDNTSFEISMGKYKFL